MGKNIPSKLRDLIVKKPYNTIAFLISVSFAILFSIFSVIQYYAVGTSAYDLGINAQELWGFIHTGNFFTPLLDENAFVQHFTIFKFIQVPLYYIFPSPITLMVFEDVFIAIAGYLIYLISNEIFKIRINSEKKIFMISLILLISYEISPYVESLVSFPFHNMAFLPFFFLLAFYAFITSRRILQIISILFIISLHANFVYIVAVLLVYEFLYLHTYNGVKIKIWLSRGSKPGRTKDFIILVISIVLLYGYVVMAGIIKLHIAGISSYSLTPSTGESGSPVGSPLALIGLAFHNPQELISIINVNKGEKMFYIKFMYESTGYIAIFSPLSFIMDLPYILYALPSSYSSYYQIGYQYSALIIGAVYISTIMGCYNIIRLYDYFKGNFNEKSAMNINKYWSGNRGEKRILAICTVIVIVIIIAMVPYGLFSPPHIQQSPYHDPMNDIFEEHISAVPEYLTHFSDQIPQSSYILTENTLMPYFSNHLNVYASPYTPGYYNNLSRFQYIVLQNNSAWANINGNHSLEVIMKQVLHNGTFSVIDKNSPDGIVILKNNNIKASQIRK